MYSFFETTSLLMRSLLPFRLWVMITTSY